ncbi:hypothetical protein EROM_081540 [Encephalitozoon romaleae SJ-2008]|uniref:Uncharacterized protein n=1 Tax=Encephalitozoon romaleae (strain SJ-2008) TaxID=1178016 RepID=I7AFQ1_ENCRO|nr:hypothetical protein EROM_081540 [Encephalitozoon romaleae SJ-2008]AFN83570.1 hypothetical protein EROM_081540 [Encephalitozoon romaleae SJ-2008]
MSEFEGPEEKKLESFTESDISEKLKDGEACKSVKKRILSMNDENEDNSKQIRTNPHYRKNVGASTIQDTLGEGKRNDVLKQAIRKRDLSYINEFLVRKDRGMLLKTLSYDDKEVLGEMLLEFVDQPVRSEALETMREIVTSIRDVSLFIERLKERAVDFSKLIYLKGKIDYLRFTSGGQEEKEPEMIVKG